MQKLILFKSVNAQFAVDYDCVSEIQPMSALSESPIARHERQTLAYKGGYLKLIDIGAQLAPQPPPPDAKALLLKPINGAPPVAVWMDAVIGTFSAEAEQIHDLPPVFSDMAKAYFPHVFRLNDQLALVLDSAALANGEQFSHISSFQFEENLTRHNKRPQIVHQVHAVGSSQQVQQSDSEKLNILIEETINQMFAGRVHHVLSRMTAGLFEPNTKPEKYNTVNPEIKNTRLKKSLQTKVRHNKSTGQVLVFPARSPKFKNRQVYYLFSLRQVVDVLRQANTQPVPFSPQYVEGIAEWRGRVLPVLSLEQCLGIGMSKEAIPMRTIVVRGAQQSDGNEVHDFYAIFNVGAAVRQYDLPLECKPLAIPQWIANGYCLSGAYQMDKQVLLAINLENVLAIDQTDKPGIVSQERSCIENLL